MRVDGYGPTRVRAGGEEDLGRLDRVVGAEAETEAVRLVEVQRVRVEHADVHQPFFQIVGSDQHYAWW